eukprot:m51a1_g11070 hypothetical protein (328) ;mRNA; f:548884-551220
MADKCVACGKTVYAMEKTVAEGKVYHKACLKCEICKKTVSYGKFSTRQGSVYCDRCYEEHFVDSETKQIVSDMENSYSKKVHGGAKVRVFDSSIRKRMRKMTLDDDDDLDVFTPRSTRHRASSPRRSERSVDSQGNTPLIQAALSGSKAAVDRCLAHGADIDAQNFEGQTALFAACAAGYDDIAEVLMVRGGADPNLASLEGTVPLHAAAASDDAHLVALLLDHGAFPNARDDEGDSPLHWAAREGARRAAAVLLRRGADPALCNEDGETPLDVDPSVLLCGSVPSPCLFASPSTSSPLFSSSAPPCALLSPSAADAQGSTDTHSMF